MCDSCSEDGGMEKRSDRRLLHPAHPGADPRRRLQKAPPSLQKEKRRWALGVSNIPAALSRSFTAWAGVAGTLRASCFERADDGFFFRPPRLRKSAGTKGERLSLTQADANEAANGRHRGNRFKHFHTEGAVFPEIHFKVFFSKLFSRFIWSFLLFVFSSLGAATPGMMGKSIWSEHVSGSGEQTQDNFK